MRTRRAVVPLLPALFAICLVSAACSNGATAAGSSGSPTASPTVRPIDPNFDYGDTILMTDTGFQPKFLLTNPHTTITWKNQTNRVWTVIFDHQAVHSKNIPTGGTFTWISPTPVSVTYHDGTHPSFKGSITVQI